MWLAITTIVVCILVLAGLGYLVYVGANVNSKADKASSQFTEMYQSYLGWKPAIDKLIKTFGNGSS